MNPCRWTGATLLGQLAVKVAAGQQERLELRAAAWCGRAPPAFDGAAVRGVLRCVLPPPLSKVAVGRGYRPRCLLHVWGVVCGSVRCGL